MISPQQYPASSFAKQINFPITDYFQTLKKMLFNQEKSSISFLSGDPTIYGRKQFKMPERGYQIMKQMIIDQANHGYSASTGLPAFKQAILKLYHPKFALKSSDIQINHGVNMGLLAVLMAMTNEGDQVLIPDFGYPFFNNLCPAMNRKAISYRLKKQNNFEIDLEHLASLVTDKTSFIYIVNPSNPVGSVFSRKHMEQIINFSDKYEIPLVCDEVYFKQVYPGVQAISFGQIVEDTPIIILSGVQKILSVPGWVQSWTIFFDKHQVLKQIKYNLQIIGTIFLHTNVFIQKALVKILEQIGIFTSNNMKAIYQNSQWLCQKLKEYPQLNALKAEGTIYLAVQINFDYFQTIKSDKQFVKLLRLQQNVNVLPLSIMGETVQGLRLLTCVNKQMYEQFFARLGAFIKKHVKK